jgi:RHS repeat-associated protein
VLKDHLGSASVVTSDNGSWLGEQRYYPYGETRLTSGTIYTDKLFTGQREMAGLGIYHYGARFYSPYLNHFTQPDSIVPDPHNPQDWNRYAYARNNPLKYTDPSGHKPCEDIDGICFSESQATKVWETKQKDKGPIWSTAKYKNEKAGKFLGDLSTRLQHAANFFSYLGGISEVGFTTLGLFGGGAAVGWVDLGFPVADVTGGLAGGLVGWEVGHGIHVLITNPIESGISSASTITTYLSDIAYGNTRLDVYESNVTAVIGQPTATSTALTLVGNANSVGIVDAAIDQVGSWYVDGKIGGVYDLFGITGDKYMTPYFMSPYLSIQFGDK